LEGFPVLARIAIGKGENGKEVEDGARGGGGSRGYGQGTTEIIAEKPVPLPLCTTNRMWIDLGCSCEKRAINLLTPNVNYSGRTAPLTSKVEFYIFI